MNTFDSTDLNEYMDEAEPIAKVLPASAWSTEIDEYLSHGNLIHGAKMPWPNTHDNFRFRGGEVTLWQGINGHGKSQVLGQVCVGFLAQGEQVCIASFEMKPVATYFRMLRQAAMTNSPAKPFSDLFVAWLENKFWIYDHLGAVESNRVFAAIRYAAIRLGVKHFVVDNLMKCVKGEDDYSGQKHFVDKVCALAREHNIHIHLVHHVRKGASEDAIPGKFDSRGSGTITDQVDNILTVWRNKSKEAKVRIGKADEVTLAQGDAIIQCDKHRHGEWEGRIKLWFHPASLQYVANASGRPFDLTGGQL
jgi:twinkle protein